MLQHFAGAVSALSRQRLHDSTNVAPFANLRTVRGSVKAHGIAGATGEIPRPDNPPGVAARPAPAEQTPSGGAPSTPRRLDPASSNGGRAVSQKVTAKDLGAGRIRFPRSSKRLFPSERAYVDVDVRGCSFTAIGWDPRDGPDRERSGVLSFGIGNVSGRVPIAVGDVLSLTADSAANRFELR
jgi:hypothetical protein